MHADRAGAAPAAPAARVQGLQRAYEAFNRRDVDDLLAMLDPDVLWPNVAEGVTLRGRAAVCEYWAGQFRRIDPRVEPTGFVACGDTVIVAVRQTVRDPDGRVIHESEVAHAYAFRGPRMAAMRAHASVAAARDAEGG